MQFFQKYTDNVAKKFSNENTSEYGYRSDLEALLGHIFSELNIHDIQNDPLSLDGSKPDFVIVKNQVPMLYIETKNIGVSLDKIEKTEQMSRYYGYANLVLTDYLEFRFYRNGERYQEPIILGTYDKRKRTIKINPGSFQSLQDTLLDFTTSHREPIKKGSHLSKIMGGKARRIRDNALQSFKESRAGDLHKVYESIKRLLVHNLDIDSFADMYAQTLVYGLFVARFHDETPEDFSRAEARDLIPASNPFLRNFFDHIAGPNFDNRIKHIVDELCEVFQHANVAELMNDYYNHPSQDKGFDPVIHFYEDFLQEYDPALRKSMGAYYTPQPVVKFIVDSVDYLLKDQFHLHAGLADASQTDSKTHKVQILDPAVGTGTFLSMIIEKIQHYMQENGQQGRWHKYVYNDLLPRLHGFEIMMAPYTIAHLKLSMAFKDKGFKYFNDKRLGIYLTNSLEGMESNVLKPESAFGFAESIAQESLDAMRIKNETPIMVILGNPPYSVSSQNKGEWITRELSKYKKNLKERNIQPLSDDYIKFIRLTEYFIEKNGLGIVAMITNNSFLDGTIHRKMREHLLKTFDDIYILNLHGSGRRQEKSPDGSKDENVFNIQTGVSINIFIKKDDNKEFANVYYSDIYGDRQYKFSILNGKTLQDIDWNKIDTRKPSYFFIPRNYKKMTKYESGFALNEVFKESTPGVTTHDDKNLVSFDEFQDSEFSRLYFYRPFDFRYINYDLGEIGRPRYKVMRHMKDDNLALIAPRLCRGGEGFQHGLITKNLVDRSCGDKYSGSGTYMFPLYLGISSSKNSRLHNLDNSEWVSNIDSSIRGRLEEIVGQITDLNILDYIIAVMYSQRYRDEFAELLIADYARIPYPKDVIHFKKLMQLGSEIRKMQLLEHEKLQKPNTIFPEAGSDIIKKTEFENNKVWINNEQYFGNIIESTWNFSIGGYQPAQKWLKDRKGRDLTNSEIEYYQKMITALSYIQEIMQEIDASY